MLKIRSVVNPTKAAIVVAIIFSILVANSAFSQSSDTTQSYQQPSEPNHPTTRPLPENPSDLNKQPRKIQRIGTAIPAPRNSVSIKSTDAGAIHRPPPAPGCPNCGVIDFVNKLGQGPGLNAIAGGVVAGTIAREIIRQTPHAHGAIHPNAVGGISGGYGGNVNHPGQPDNPYQVGVTMSDGSQAIIALPDASNLQQGDRIQFIDGVLVLDRQ